MTSPKTYKRDRAIYVIGNVAFVANPASRSAWWKTHAAVAFAACPECRAPIGELCVPSFGFCRGGTRRRAAHGRAAVATKVVAHEEMSS